MKILLTALLVWFNGYKVSGQAPVKILTLGNSITNGTGTFNSYRRCLWKLLKEAHYNADFIGSWNKHHMGADVPDPDFDMDHEGHSGWTTANIFEPPLWDSAKGNIYKWLKTYKPDIVIVELGTNDVFQCRKLPDVIADFKKLVKVLREKNRHVKIYIGQIPPLGTKWRDKKLCGNEESYDESVIALNKMLKQLCISGNRKGAKLVSVDQYTRIDPSREMYDDIHPNASGEAIMAKRWFEAIKGDLPKL